MKRCASIKDRVVIRFTTKGAFGDTGSPDVVLEELDDDDEPFLKSLQNPCVHCISIFNILKN